jgi:hypothetical protein
MLPTAIARPTTAPRPSALAAIVLATATVSFVAGLGAAQVHLPAIGQGVAPAPTFDAVRFRAEEREPLFPTPAPTFDAVRFRAEEREPLFPTSPHSGALDRAHHSAP